MIATFITIFRSRRIRRKRNVTARGIIRCIRHFCSQLYSLSSSFTLRNDERKTVGVS